MYLGKYVNWGDLCAVLMGCVLGLAACALIDALLCSCRSVRYVPVETVRRDTVYKARRDSSAWAWRTQVRDSVRLRDSTVLVVDTQGNVLRTGEWHWRDRLVYASDSSAYLRGVADSLIASRSEVYEKPYPVERQLTWWQRFRQGAFWPLAACCLLLGLVVVLWMRRAKGAKG